VSISGYVPSDTEDNTSGDESKLYPLEGEVEVLEEIEIEIEELQQAATTGARKRKQKNALASLLEEGVGRDAGDLTSGDLSQLLEGRRPRTDRASSSRRGAATGGSSRQNGAPSEVISIIVDVADDDVMLSQHAAPPTVAAAKAAPHAKKQKRVSRELASLQEQHLQQQGAEVAGTRSWRS
jgi:hypothetical protein